MISNTRMKTAAIFIYILVLGATSSFGADWSCLNDAGTGWTGVMCGNDINGNGMIDDCGELLSCQRPASGQCQQSPLPTRYECVFPDKSRVTCSAALFGACPQCTITDVDNPSVIIMQGTVTPIYKYHCTLDNTDYEGLVACQGACGGQCQCGQGGLYNSTTNLCEVEVALQCAEGYLFDDTVHLCVAQIQCPSGTHFDSTLDRCIGDTTYKCPDNFLYDAGTGKCVHIPNCPPGSVFSTTSLKCEAPPSINCPANYTFNSGSQKCEAAPNCGAGVLNTSSDVCQLLPTITCPANYVYSSSTLKCEEMPYCLTGGTFDAVDNRCESIPGITCATSYIYNSTTQQCQTGPGCPAGGAYVGLRDRCEAADNPQCPVSYTYNSVAERCEKAPQCASGSYNPTTDRCELSISPTCPTGYTYGGGVCYANPVCATGTFNSVSNSCETAGTPQCSTGYSYNATAQKCQSAPQCTTGGSYSATTNRCETSSTQNYTCSINGQVYSSSAACTAGCSQTSNCTAAAGTITLSGSTTGGKAPALPLQGSLTGSGSYIALSPFVSGGNLAISGATLSGSLWWTNPPLISPQMSIIGYGTWIGINCVMGLNCGGSITVSGATVSGTMYMYQNMIDSTLTGSGNTLISNVGGSLVFSGPTTYTCPLGGFACSGNPQQCTNTGSCSSSTVCPAGYTLNGGVCVTAASCLSSGVLNTSSDQCELTASFTCPTGFLWNGSTCQKAPTCNSGGTFTSSTHRCEITPSYVCPGTMTWDATAQKCRQASTCATGGTLNTSFDLCISTVNYNCPAGYTYAGSAICSAPASCPGTGTLNISLDQCQSTPVYNCPTGYTYSSGTCNANAKCDTGGTLNTASHKCEASSTNSCPTGWSMNAVSHFCEITPVCASPGVYSTSANTCQVDASYQCGSGFTLNPITLKCEADPQCPTGSSINSTTHSCQTDPTIICPVGTTYNIARGSCESSPLCNVPGSYNPILKECTTPGTPECPPDYQYSSLENKCTAPPVCTPSDWMCPNDAADPVCNNQAPIMNRQYMELETTTTVDPDTGNYLPPPSYTFASTNAAVSQQTFETIAQTYGAHPADMTYKGFIFQQYGTGPFRINQGVLYQDVFFDTLSCPLYQDFSNRIWQPKDFSDRNCANFPTKWEKIETSCLCTDYTQDIYQRSCTGTAPYYTETLLNTLSIKSDMSTCAGDPLFCKAGLSQQGLNDCTANQTTYTDFISCNGQSIEKTRTVRTCIASTTATVPTEYRTIPDNLFGIMQWDSVRCHPCITPQSNVVDDDIPSGPDIVLDQTKQCTNFKMFSGSDKRCRPSGFGTIFTNCCSLSGWFSSWCNNEEKELKKKKESKICHEVGTYCSSRVKFLGICLQRKKSYCCFNSMLSRIINEQGRTQINKPWGPAKTPDCHGFSPDDFSKLDFSTIDLTEYSNTIQSNTYSAPGEVMKGVNNWMQTQQNKSFLGK